jgi:hypothetical protein
MIVRTRTGLLASIEKGLDRGRAGAVRRPPVRVKPSTRGEEHAMHRCGSLRVRLLRAWPLIAAFGLGSDVANGEDAPGPELDLTLSPDAGLAPRSSAEVDAGGRDGALQSSDAGAPALSVESPADLADAGAGSTVALADHTPFGDPAGSYSPPTFEVCFPDPVVFYRVEAASPEGTPCDLEH